MTLLKYVFAPLHDLRHQLRTTAIASMSYSETMLSNLTGTALFVQCHIIKAYDILIFI